MMSLAYIRLVELEVGARAFAAVRKKITLWSVSDLKLLLVG